jgi:hypothetical protein
VAEVFGPGKEDGVQGPSLRYVHVSKCVYTRGEDDGGIPREVTLFLGLDDFLIVTMPIEALIEIFGRSEARLGFLINEEKPTWSRPVMDFLGVSLSFSVGRVYPSMQRTADIVACVNVVCGWEWIEAQLFLRLLGLRASLVVVVVPGCRLHMRQLQLLLAGHCRPWAHGLGRRIPISIPSWVP